MNKKIFIVALLVIVSTSMFAQKKPFTIEALYKVKGVGAPSFSPDGKKAIFTVSQSNLQTAKSNTDIYIMNSDGSGITPLINSDKSEYEPQWLTDSEILYQVGGNLYKFNLATRKNEQLTSLSIGLSTPVITPDKQKIIFATMLYPQCGASDSCNQAETEKYEKSPLKAYIADELMFRHWTSYKEELDPHLVMYDLKTKKITDLASSVWLGDAFMLGGGMKYAISPDGKEAAFISTDDKGSRIASSTNSDIFIIDINNPSSVKNITKDNKAWDGAPVFSPDGKYIAYKFQKEADYEADRYRLGIYDRAANTFTNLTEDFDYNVEDMIWSDDSKTIYFTSEVKGYTPIHKIDLASKKIEQISGNITVSGFDVNKNKDILFGGRNIDKPTEIYILNKDKSVKKVTAFNDSFLSEYDVRPAEQVWIEGADGIKVHTFIVKPHNFDPNKKYPIVLNVHGGPQSAWLDAFRGDWQVYSGYGYIIAFANPHGSTGYGSAYTRAISGDYGGKVFEDLMKVTDYLEALPYVDKDRMGAMGWSFGGYMMNWFQAQTTRFKCLASMMGLYDLESMWGATEELWFVNKDLAGQPWTSDNYDKYSPSNFVKNFKTPTLILTGELDYRVPYTQSVQYFTTLQTLGIDSRLVVFKNDGHWPHNLKSMPLYYNSHLEWFNKYLGGDKAPYDSKDMLFNWIK